MKTTYTYCYMATDFYGKCIDCYDDRLELISEMKERGYKKSDYDIIIICEEWVGDGCTRRGEGESRKEAKLNLQ